MTVVVTVMLVEMVPLSTACSFPPFMQNGTDRDWRSHVKDQFMEFQQRIVVSDHIMDVQSTDNSVPSYKRFCLQDEPGEKYLVAHEEAGQQGNRYTCMQFVKRTHNVVQLKVANISERMDRSLCDDSNMRLEEWILIDRSHITEDRQMCPLQGGFSIVIYDRVTARGICDSYQGHTRLESECVSGEGLLFHFRHVKCVPQHVYMYARQRTLCLAHWTEGMYTFMLIKHDVNDYIWMFRYQTFYGDQAHGDSFVALLLNDLVAEQVGQVTQTRNYVRLSCARDQPLSVNSLCVDDYEICAHRREPCPVGDDDGLALTCPRSCGVCNASRPAVCNFPTRLQGTWQEVTHSGVVSLSVNSTILTVRGHMEETFHCIQWDPPRQSQEGSHTELMLVSDYNNGCKPRYTCARFLQKGTNTLFFGLSENQQWPFTDSVSDPIDCRSFEYTQDTSLYPNPFRGRRSKMLFSSSAQTPVPCGLPSDMHTFTVNLRDGSQCSSTLTENPDGTTLILTMSQCPENTLIQDTSFMCIESSRMLPNNDFLIITRTARNPGVAHCWIFPRKPHSTIYLVEGVHCNEETKKRIRKNRLKPLGIFTKSPEHLIQDVSPDDSREVTTITPPPSGDAVTTADRKVLQNGTGPHGNETKDSVDSEDVNATPFVVIGAILFFAVLQIPCGCGS